MNCFKRFCRRTLFLFTVLLVTAAMLVTGCGEEEKFNKEKAEILEELKQVQETGKIWLSVLTFGQPLQPVYLATEKPPIFDPE